LSALVEATYLLGGRSDRSRSLLGGVAIGVLAGAAVAGMLLRGRKETGPRRRLVS
jgi:hypothetical protein